jgi:hypothetical protein
MLIKKSGTSSETIKSAHRNDVSIVATVSRSLIMHPVWNNKTPNGAVKRSSRSKVRLKEVKFLEMFVGEIKCYLGCDIVQLP